VAGVVIIAQFADPEPPREDPRMQVVGGCPEFVTVASASTPSGSAVATLDSAGRIALRRADGGWTIERRLSCVGQARRLAWSPDGRSLAVGGIEPRILIFDLDRAARPRALPLPIDRVSVLAFSPDGRALAATTARDGAILLCDPASGRLSEAWMDAFPVRSLAFSPDGRSLASGGADYTPTIVVRDLATGQSRLRCKELHGPIAALAFSPDGTCLATAATFERCVRIRDAATGELRRVVEGHALGTNAIAFSPDGKSLASAGNDGTVRLWCVATGRQQDALDGGAPAMGHVAFLGGGWLAATSRNDNALRVWPLCEPSPGSRSRAELALP
jgi:WD40 repeat protein